MPERIVHRCLSHPFLGFRRETEAVDKIFPAENRQHVAYVKNNRTNHSRPSLPYLPCVTNPAPARGWFHDKTPCITPASAASVFPVICKERSVCK